MTYRSHLPYYHYGDVHKIFGLEFRASYSINRFRAAVDVYYDKWRFGNDERYIGVVVALAFFDVSCYWRWTGKQPEATP